jgi:hypothetical protein
LEKRVNLFTQLAKCLGVLRVQKEEEKEEKDDKEEELLSTSFLSFKMDSRCSLG